MLEENNDYQGENEKLYYYKNEGLYDIKYHKLPHNA